MCNMEHTVYVILVDVDVVHQLSINVFLNFFFSINHIHILNPTLVKHRLTKKKTVVQITELLE